MSTSISSEAITLHTDGQNKNRIDAHYLEESSPQFQSFIFNSSRENHHPIIIYNST